MNPNENIQDYMTPYLDQIIAKKDSYSADAARGLLGASGAMHDIGEYVARLWASEHWEWRIRFNTRRLKTLLFYAKIEPWGA